MVRVDVSIIVRAVSAIAGCRSAWQSAHVHLRAFARPLRRSNLFLCVCVAERVTLTMRAYQFGDIRDLVTFEGAGAATCDDESTCDDHGGAVFAYDPTRIRVWLPDQSNGRPYGLAIQVGDGWGDGQRNIQAHEVQVMAKVWTKHRKDEQPYFDTTFQMRSGAGAPRNTAFKEITYNANGRRPGFPDRMLVETSPISGPNRGFAFVSKGASVHDNDGGKVGADCSRTCSLSNCSSLAPGR